MRRIVVFNRMTVNGCFAGPGGSTDWFVPEPAIDRAAAQSTSAFDTFLFGRRTYELFSSFWPHALEAGAGAPHGEGQLSTEQRALAISLNQTTKLVVSRTLKEATWQNSRILPGLERDTIISLKHGPGKDILVLGSGSVTAQLASLGLIDEYQLVLSPSLLGGGTPLFEGLAASQRLELLEVQAHPSNNVLLRYQPAA